MKWQLLIFDAVTKFKMIYALETVHLTQAMMKKIDAFQLRCLRKILGLAPTFIDRRNTNHAVPQECADIAFTNREDHKEISLFSEYYLCRKTKLLGHVLRAPEDDPLKTSIF